VVPTVPRMVVQMAARTAVLMVEPMVARTADAQH
jgi:hypothetical protein